jgi:GWxTD domain-containing protein
MLRRTICFILFLSFLSCAWASSKDAVKALPPHYREWLQKDVIYIISNQERDAFLQLTSDAARDEFIQHFWEIRNPTPGSPDNPYKVEHYRRLEYATQYFGHASHTEGWRTAMGRIYITLGEPQQRQKLLGLQKITPMEIWFYSNTNPALPPFFYVIFYQRDVMDEFRVYSPYSDGPEKLITAVAGPSRQDALKILSDDAGGDVARETLSLIPDEPVDLQDGTVSLQSDIMLSTIRDLANNPISQAELANRRRLLEDVSHRVVLGDEYLDVTTIPLRDPAGNPNLHYVLRFKKPEDFSVAQGDKGYYYSVLESAKVFSSEGKLLLNDEKKISRSLTSDQFEQMKGKLFGYEGWLPLPPGQYKLQFQLTNVLNNTAVRREVEVGIPDPAAPGLKVTNMVPFADAIITSPESSRTLPFSGAGVKFIPMAGQELQLTQGRSLKFFYQVWLPHSPQARPKDSKLEVDYVYGTLGARDNKTIHDEIPLDQLDSGGSIVNGKQILTGELAPGNYRLVMTVRDPQTQNKAYGSLNFSVYPSAAAPAAWDISDDKIADSINSGVTDYERASCYMAFGDNDHALPWLQNAYLKNPADERFRSHLIELYFARQQYEKVADIYAKVGISDATDEQTIARIAESFEKTGEIRKAVGVMESGTALKPSSGPLLLGLAEYYRKTGDLQKASAAEQKGKQLMSAHPES